jgi:hypothetical protein
LIGLLVCSIENALKGERRLKKNEREKREFEAASGGN